MGILETVKNLFGFSSSPSAPSTTPPVEQERAPVAPKPRPSGPPPAAQRRNQIIRFVIEKLRAYQNEPDNAPIGLRLFVLSENTEDEEVFRVALWAGQPGKFRSELNRHLADNYITLAKDWLFEVEFFRDQLPNSTYREGNLGLVVLDLKKSDGPVQLASVRTLVGQTEQEVYALDPAQKALFYIGRGQSTQTASGRVRVNDIVILPDDAPGFDPQKGAGNGAVSRAHATIQYNPAQRKYALLVDPGGLPANGNKTKIMHPDDTIERADILGVTYPLQSGDQIELGGEVTLLFELR
ncbi:FHA domain-containing protein [Larkinella insperata]|uniref:FHA domain-containing protein n=1 Tax=Larkinella insperata TaxID=332158 RepID=A0ABW3Q8L7_9BACT|nr:FHA domain-containing protein [Larkinella insperata]